MDVLMRPNQEIMAALGKQPRLRDKEYRLNTFCLIEEIMNGKLINNTMTASLIFLTNAEFERMYEKPEKMESWQRFLYDGYFLVEKDFDEFQFIKSFREKNAPPVDDFYLEEVSEYTILTTTACNARCFYCYEQNVKKEHMSVKTAEKVADYIISKSPKNRSIELRWFGGEPLFNAKVINTICKKIGEAGIMYTSFFTTNGYLFDKDLIKKAKELWHITSCQITIDGTENVYNKAKNYIYKDVASPYKRVIGNIEDLINNGVQVMIRMNVDLYNADDLKNLVFEVYQRFGNHPNLAMYCYPIFENEFYSRSDDDRSKVFDKMFEVEDVMDECRMFYGSSIRRGIRCGHCMVDNAKAVTISPKGDLGLCEHYVESEFWGHIDKPNEMDMDMIRSFRVYEKDLDICADCPIYPSCVRASKCEEQSKCYPEYKAWLVRKAKQGIRKAFYQHMENKAKRTERI